ncbi:uncharacterized protein VP01_7851g2 [Puccinia sorghi]|uniref:Uncharacterized protein n=1 Tax=Puccinia sorghi TaxID=27349 RepID=A0A0L6UB25_9BASI|nr:uncharacterized protein VP01_7851g2 [Puccinia sorghi]
MSLANTSSLVPGKFSLIDKFSDPVVKFCETVVDTSILKVIYPPALTYWSKGIVEEIKTGRINILIPAKNYLVLKKASKLRAGNQISSSCVKHLSLHLPLPLPFSCNNHSCLALKSNELTESHCAAMAEIDTAKFGWFQVCAVLVSGNNQFHDNEADMDDMDDGAMM